MVATDACLVANRNEGDQLPGQEITGYPRELSDVTKEHFARLTFQTDSDEDVILVSEKSAPKSHEIDFDQAKRLALQRDIDEHSQPRQIAKPLTSQRSAAVQRQVERVKMRIEEETSEEKLVKKEKKKKKGQIKNDKCPVGDGGSPVEVKKEKKGKKVDVVVIDVEEESSGKEEKKKKKKRKIVTESPNDTNGSDVKTENNVEIIKKKKKKKKQLADGESQVETGQISLKQEEVAKKPRKEKTVKNKSVQIKSENVKMETAEEERQAENDKLPKKAKKEKNTLVVSTEEAEEQVEVKKKKKKKEKSADEETSEAMDEMSVTKKKKKSKVAENLIKTETPEGEMGEVEGVKKSSKKRLKEKREKEKGKPEMVTIEEEKMELKKKRKASVEISEVEETEPKKKKKRTKGEEEEEPPSLKCEGVEEQSGETPVSGTVDTISKKKKKKKISSMVETEVDVSFESSSKKKKRKKIKEEVESEQELPQVDVVFLSAKSGNADEVTINQERRQALQMEIDQASQPRKPAKPTGLGQWSTAQFDSSDQQQKFLRLMGGFKKGFQPAAGSAGRANMALGKDAQQQLQQGLLGEFERAQSRRMDFNNRGAGLGFAAPSNKKFFIDVNASRSVRFDD